MHYDYDLITIGAGSGGVAASRRSAALGARVLIAEASRVGGTCVIRGCVPKKFFVYASEYGHGFAEAAHYGWSAENLKFDWPTLRDNVAALAATHRVAAAAVFDQFPYTPHLECGLLLVQP